MAALSKPAAVLFSVRLKSCSTSSSTKMALNMNANDIDKKRKKNKIRSDLNNNHSNSKRKLHVLLFDIMDTIVRDPFYHDVPAFFRMSMKELVESKHPTAWNEFERGLINEMELAEIFFKDGRPFDLEGLKNCMRSGYTYVEGVEELLCALKQNHYEMHAFTNYPIWYEMIEDKLKLSTYLSWSFCSCITGKRKPEPNFYLEVLRHLGVDPARCIFIDDRMTNVDSALDAGMIGIHFKDAKSLCQDLSLLGIDFSTHGHDEDPVD